MNNKAIQAVTLTGIYANALGGFMCVRGFARAKAISEASYADFDYQRDLYEKHEEQIKRFLSNKQSLFFPEIVLSYTIEHDFTKETGANPFEQMYSTKGFTSNIDGTKIILYKKGTAMITIKQQCLKRIDGNHRLTAIERSDEFNDLLTPFCLLIFPNDDTGKSKKDEMTIFHNINSMAIPLTFEEKLKGLMGIFSAEELEKNFGRAYSETKIFMNTYGKYWDSHYSSLEYAFKNEPYTIILRTFEFVPEHLIGASFNVEKMHRALLAISSRYFDDNPKLQASNNMYSLITYVFYCVEGGCKDNAKLRRYVQYIMRNNLQRMRDFDPSSMIDLFNNLSLTQRRQIFVAMPFIRELEFVFTQIVAAVNEINENYDSDIPIPKRIDKEIKGFSYDIVEEICNEIDYAGLIIADLTYANPNVYYEAGFAYGLMRTRENSAKILYLISNPNEPSQFHREAKFDVNHFKIIPYTNDGSGAIQLKEDLMNELITFYGLK